MSLPKASLNHSPSPESGTCRRAVAIDLGAESCRVSLAQWNTLAGPSIHTVHRFSNGPVERGHSLFWDLERILCGVEEGLRLCARVAEGPIDSIGVDGWAVDYVRLGNDRRPLGDPFCYRDPRTEERHKELWEKIPAERIYELTGIQMLRFNTVYQLFADHCEGLVPGELWLNIPEYVLFHLGGRPAAEYTNATHTQMVDAGRRQWCEEILRAAGIDSTLMPEIAPPGTVLGKLQGPLAKLSVYKDTKLIAPACHDTGSAVAGIPYEGDEWAFLSSGTWSLVGSVFPRVCVTERARRANFSNEGGLGGQVRFLKNVNGMWILQECLRDWKEHGANWTIESLVEACRVLPPPKEYLRVDDPELLLPGNMTTRINHALEREGKLPIAESSENAPEIANLVFHSLAFRYASILGELETVTGKRFRRLYVVGGGSKNEYLNRLIAETTGLEVIRGPVESSTIGNVAIQFAVLDGDTEENWGVSPEAVCAWSRKLATAVP